MAKKFQKNPTALRYFILYECIEGKPIFEAYKHFCKVMGKRTMEYNDFEFWFMRFASGKFDFNYDRSLEPKTRSLPDMPIHIFEKIIKELKLTDRFIVRKVSKNFQYIIDSWNPGFKKICVDINKYSIYMNCDNQSIICKDHIKNNSNFTIHDLAIVLRNPKLQLEELRVQHSDNFKEFMSMLKTSNLKIRTKSVSITPNYDTYNMEILPLLEEETLENIVFSSCERKCTGGLKSAMDQMSQMEQWKKAMISLNTSTTCLHMFPIRSFTKFRRCTINFNNLVKAPFVVRFIKALTESAELEVFNLKSDQPFPLPTIRMRLGHATKVPGRQNIRRIPIPNSDEFFEIDLKEKHIRIERCS